MQLPDVVKSPLTGADSPLRQAIPTTPLVEAYRQQFGYDASHCFRDLTEVGLYQCASGFWFYYPFSIAADESLYRCLESFDWTYKPDKWEYQAALPYIDAGDRVLDVGCGEGWFLSHASRRGAYTSGIELNKKAAAVAKDKGIHVHEELLNGHEPETAYDVITAFQVLEHLVDPMVFIRRCQQLLRPGGRLIIGVPNNDSFLRLDPDNILNQPPHHMGLWSRASLSALGTMTGLQVESVQTEPLAEPDWYQVVIEKHYMGRWQRRLFHRLGFAEIFSRFIRENAHTIAGHTILAVYRLPTPPATSG